MVKRLRIGNLVTTLLKISLASLLITACTRKEPVTQSECNQLLAHYVNQSAQTADPPLNASQLERLQKEIQAKSESTPAFRQCTREVSREQMDCALHAPSADEIERCLIPIP